MGLSNGVNTQKKTKNNNSALKDVKQSQFILFATKELISVDINGHRYRNF